VQQKGRTPLAEGVIGDGLAIKTGKAVLLGHGAL
jgi:hypothetical protein